MEEFLSVQQVAELRGVSASAVYRAIREERLPSTTILGRKAIKVTDATEFDFGTYTKEGQERKERTRLPRGTNKK